MTTAPLLPGPRQGWMDRPGPPDALRDAPCRRRPDLFMPVPLQERKSGAERPRSERQEIIYRHVRARRICNGAPGYDAPCPLRMACLRWAVEAKERIVAGGVVVTKTMIMGYHEDPEGGDRAAEEAGTPQDWAGKLAERYRARHGKPNQGAGERRERKSA